MENFKINMLRSFKKIVDFLSIIALVLTVLSGAMAIFYDELSVIFETLNLPQERLAWMAVSFAGLGTSGVVLTRVSTGLKATLNIAKSDQEYKLLQAEKQFQTKLDMQEQLYMSKLESVRQEAINKQNETKQSVDLNTRELKRLNKFNELQAEKYLNSPDRVIDKETKQKYADFLKNKKGE